VNRVPACLAASATRDYLRRVAFNMRDLTWQVTLRSPLRRVSHKELYIGYSERTMASATCDRQTHIADMDFPFSIETRHRANWQLTDADRRLYGQTDGLWARTERRNCTELNWYGLAFDELTNGQAVMHYRRHRLMASMIYVTSLTYASSSNQWAHPAWSFGKN